MMDTRIRYQLMIYGAVQGIGFRPFLYRLARQLELNGWVSNIPQGVIAEIEGDPEMLRRFVERMEQEKPPMASIHSCEVTVLDSAGYSDFQIRESSAAGKKQALILPDIALCPDCLRELSDPSDRRFRYPFINCTNCGPRWSIMHTLPYDRGNTSMKLFTMCPDCRKEYNDPANRRFHAQPNACPDCGPSVSLISMQGKLIADKEEAIIGAVDAIRNGSIVAVKGIGGFHLMADPFSDGTVQNLRERKHREEKPFALMMPDIETARKYALLSEQEELMLKGTAAPIVLVRRNPDVQENGKNLSVHIAPGNPLLGIMLPYAPLHHIMMGMLQHPVIATSGNRADEPICIDDRHALEQLSGIADVILTHNRPIVRHSDDSIVGIIGGREAVIRRSRGLAPLPVRLAVSPNSSLLAVGGHLKNTVAMNVGSSVFLSQHLGDLETEESVQAFRNAVDDLRTMYDTTPSSVIADVHPEYCSTTFARECPFPLVQIQHHQAHIFSCMAENHLTGDLLGVSWDGTGYGDDGTIWGGEFFSWSQGVMERVGTFRSFPLPGSSAAVKEPRRSALGLLYELSGGDLTDVLDLPTFSQFSMQEIETLGRMMHGGLNSPRTSSVGRLFDAVSSLTGLRARNAYEGQAAMELEALTERESGHPLYPFTLRSKSSVINEIDWSEMILGLIDDIRNNAGRAMIAQKFHDTLCEMIVAVARISPHRSVVLSGGCFQNAYLTERAIGRLREEGYTPYWHQRIPPNDGGISLGQLYGAVLTDKNTD